MPGHSAGIEEKRWAYTGQITRLSSFRAGQMSMGTQLCFRIVVVEAIEFCVKD